MSEKRAREQLNYFKAVVFFITLGVVPLMVYYSVTPAAPEEVYLLTNTTERTDMFSYYKSWLFAVCTVLLGLNSLWDFMAANRKFDYRRCLKNPFTVLYALFFVVFLILGVINNVSGGGVAPSDQTVMFVFAMVCYSAIFLPHLLIAAFRDKFNTHIPRPLAVAAVVFLAAVLATCALTDYRYMSFHGAIERCESVFAVLGYIIILIEIADFAAEKRGAQVIFASLIFSASVIGVIGFFQLIGMDVFYTDIANRVVLREAYDQGVRLSPRMNQAYATLYNPNCVGIYSAMMSPLMFAAAVLWPKNSPFKYILFTAAAFGIICMFGSNSSAGLIGCIAAFASLVVLVFANFVKNKKSMKMFIIIAASAGAVIVAGMFIPAVNSRVMIMAGKFIVLPQTDIERGYLRDLSVQGNTAHLFIGDKSISITNEDGEILVSDSTGVIEADYIEAIEDGNGGVATYSGLEGWPEFTVTTYYSTVTYAEQSFLQHFGVDGMGNILALSSKGEAVDLQSSPPGIGFEDYQFFASSRGYIWSKSIPLLMNNLLIGVGVDSFIMEFPQNDVLGKTRFFQNPYIMVDKPHNMYLQTAVNTGVLSLIMQLSIFVVFLLMAVKRLVCIPKMNSLYYATLLGVTSGVAGYMLTGLSTDSTVSVSPIFWAILGLGYACINALDHGLE